MANTPDLLIGFEFDDITPTKSITHSSDVVYASNLPWKLLGRTINSEVSGRKELRLSLFCNSANEYTGWSCDATIKTVLVNVDPDCNIVKEVEHKFLNDGTGRGCIQSLDWEYLADPEKGFLKDGQCTIETKVFIKKTKNVRVLKLKNYSIPASGQGNVILFVEGKKLHVSKDYLSIHSPVFAAIFTDNLTDLDNQAIKLEGVEYEKFVDLLNVIYPTKIEINSSTVKHILPLADLYQIDSVLSLAELYLMNTTKFDLLAKLVFANQYKLDVLLNHILSNCTKMSTLKALKPTDEYDEFSADTKAAICDRMMDLCTTCK